MSLRWVPAVPVAVEEVDSEGVPRAFRWEGRRWRVGAVLNRWRVERGWWEGGVAREHVLLLTEEGLVVEVVREAGGEWGMQRLYD